MTPSQENHLQLPVERGVTAAALAGRPVAVIGYGNQGRAHALNLRDSGVDVRIGGRPGSTARARAESEGFRTLDTPEAVRGADLVIVALPDEAHAAAWAVAIAPSLVPGQTAGFIHGSSVHFGLVKPVPGVGMVLVAPKGPGTTLRERFVMGQGIPALVAMHAERDRAHGGPGALDIARAWAAGLGCARAGLVHTTFRDEAETDLFGEQAVLCGGMLGLAQAAYEVLVEAGYPPLLAYTECIHEIKQVADLLYARGPAGMRAAISNSAEFGTYAAAPRMADERTKAAMRTLLDEIRSGAFTRRMQADHDAGGPWFRAERAAADAHPMERAGAEVRALMPWLAAEPGGEAETKGANE
ncbi:MAG: ketol-acid reductoisomerase [Planctomycetota bacterium]